jgi:hypothetical protein
MKTEEFFDKYELVKQLEAASTLNRELKEDVGFQVVFLNDVISQIDRLNSILQSRQRPEIILDAMRLELPYKLDNLKEIKAKLTALSESSKEDKPLE